ncbi:hypothetical protein [Ureibacillus sinduriensis]|uniref:Uncharacterized protein n=1 Tax=Ureibacillus sinduriensis BLB-1 = JCM 15800 TaxID=1384057 RepID=A0A0A3I8L0_9BACL|nr:hypothetical protein [Ureibacillus sinduriensis]KGR79108.1 hypothetical protein CD33_00565 [Ureibacillus sinduriensis BLB-1 = JCM 15800]
MSVHVYQTFEIKQEKFKEAIENLQELKKYRNEQYDHEVEVLIPITGSDYTYAILATYEGLAEMEFQDRKMFDDEEYLKLVGTFFLEHVVQGTMVTQIYRGINKKVSNGKEEKKSE